MQNATCQNEKIVYIFRVKTEKEKRKKDIICEPTVPWKKASVQWSDEVVHCRGRLKLAWTTG
jgi:hypothetical protein